MSPSPYEKATPRRHFLARWPSDSTVWVNDPTAPAGGRTFLLPTDDILPGMWATWDVVGF